MRQKLIGICACSMLVTALARLAVPRIDTAADIYIPIICSILTVIVSVAVYKEKRWGYWASLSLAGLQVFAICYSSILASESYLQAVGDLMFKNVAVVISLVTSLMLLRKDTEQVAASDR